MSKASKTTTTAGKARGKVANFAEEREKFEAQKRMLEEEMAVGKMNMDKIQKGIKSNTISSNMGTLDLSAPVDVKSGGGGASAFVSTPISSTTNAGNLMFGGAAVSSSSASQNSAAGLEKKRRGSLSNKTEEVAFVEGNQGSSTNSVSGAQRASFDVNPEKSGNFNLGGVVGVGVGKEISHRPSIDTVSSVTKDTLNSISILYSAGMRVSEWAITVHDPEPKNKKKIKEETAADEYYDSYNEVDPSPEEEKKEVTKKKPTAADSTGPPAVKSQELYENVRFLGRGSFGDVYLVRNTDDKKVFAMKTVFSEQDSDMSKMIEELNFLRNYRHPYIIDIYDGFIIQQTRILHIIMPYCETGDLGKIIQVNRKNNTFVPESTLLRWATQIGLALHFLHEKGAIHRDLKPVNVMLTEGGEVVKLVDFGLATVLKGNVCSNATEAGTPLYTAPEIILGQPYSYPTDCWSFGVMLYELIELVTPFSSNTIGDLVKSILEDEVKAIENPNYSDEIKELIRLLLRKNPDRRLGMAGFLCDPFIQNKTHAMPQSYRPKALEDRVRRSHVKLLNAQIDNLPQSQNSSVTSSVVLKEIADVKVDLNHKKDNRNNQNQSLNNNSNSISNKTGGGALSLANPNAASSAAAARDKASSPAVATNIVSAGIINQQNLPTSPGNGGGVAGGIVGIVEKSAANLAIPTGSSPSGSSSGIGGAGGGDGGGSGSEKGTPTSPRRGEGFASFNSPPPKLEGTRTMSIALEFSVNSNESSPNNNTNISSSQPIAVDRISENDDNGISITPFATTTAADVAIDANHDVKTLTPTPPTSDSSSTVAYAPVSRGDASQVGGSSSSSNNSGSGGGNFDNTTAEKIGDKAATTVLSTTNNPLSRPVSQGDDRGGRVGAGLQRAKEKDATLNSNNSNNNKNIAATNSNTSSSIGDEL